MAIPVYLSQKDIMWRKAGRSIFTGLRLNSETPTIFGYNQIKGSRPMSAGCCDASPSPGPLGTSNLDQMDAFFPTIWSHPLETILIKNYSYGGERRADDDCCDNKNIS